MAAGAALLAVWGSGGGESQMPDPTAGERSPSSLGAASVNSQPDENRFYLPQAGFRYSYTFRRGISFQGDLGGATMPPVNFGGDFHVDVLRADSRSFEALLSENIKGSKPSPYLRIEADARGDQVTIFTNSPAGEEDKQHLSIIKDLVALWLFPLRSDTVGNFEARFEPLVAEKGFAREKKAKLSYLTKHANTPAIEGSQHYLLWDHALHLPSEVKGAESTRLGQGATALVAESRYEIKYKSRTRSPAFDHALLAGMNEKDTLALDTSKPGSMADHPDYAKLDWGTLLSQLRGLDKLTGMQQLNVFGDVLKYLRLHPEKTGELAAMLKDPALLRLGADSPLFRNIVGALATFGNAEAFAALREAYDDSRLTDGGRGTILAAMTTTQAPVDSETREFLAHKMASERDRRLADSAAFALGSALQNAGNDEQALRAIHQIEESWNATRSFGEKLSMLDVMGNSGRGEFVPTITQVIHTEVKDSAADNTLKARAVFALRFVKAPAATQELISSLSAESSVIRRSAASAIEMAEWTEAFRSPLERCSSGDNDGIVAETCRKTLANNSRVADSN